MGGGIWEQGHLIPRLGLDSEEGSPLSALLGRKLELIQQNKEPKFFTMYPYSG